MTRGLLDSCRAACCVLGLLSIPALPGEAAAQAFLEPGFKHSEVRLIEGELTDGLWSAGVEIELAEGWKTYWRMPGESGIPPVFDWSRSKNVVEVEIRWPAPRRYQNALGETIGYAGRVVFPMTVRPADAAAPVELELDLDYAVCKDICIPARAELRQVLADDGISPTGAGLIESFDAQVPSPEEGAISVESVQVRQTAEGLRLAVALGGAADGEALDIFVEGFEQAYFRAPRPAGGKGGSKLFELPIDGVTDPLAIKGSELTLTIVTDKARLVREVTVQ